MKQILTTLSALITSGVLASTASAGLPVELVELTPSSQPAVALSAHDALGMVADCYSGYGGGYGRGYGGYGGGYSYAPVSRSYYRGGGGLNINVGRGYGGYRGLPYGYGGGRGRLGPGFGPGFGGYPSRGYRGGGSGVGVFLRF